MRRDRPGTALVRCAIVTRVEPLQAFYKAEPYHQDNLRRHPEEPNIVRNDLPKLAALEQQFPALWR